jgi:capsular polysaccharide biosynthesis protein
VTGLSFTNDFAVIGDSVAEPDLYRPYTMESFVRHDFVSEFKVIPALLRRSERIESAAVSVDTVAPLCPRFRNYYHWMIQTLPKLRYLDRYERETGREVILVVPPNYPPWLSETLSLLGWPDDRIRRSVEPVIRADRLLVPSFPRIRRADLEWLRRQFLPPEGASEPATDAPNVFISRDRAIERRIVNDDHLMSVLSKYGFAKYRLEERSVAANIRLFNQADIVMGAHGAGLTDIVFCDDGAVVELFGSKVKGHYQRRAETLGVEYHPVHCESVSTDLVADVDRIETLISEELGYAPR